MRNYLIFDGNDSRDFGVYISGSGAFTAPSRGYNMIDVPGRNGSLSGYDHRLETVEITYPAFMYADFRENFRGFRSALLAGIGFCRLEDSYHPDEYRKAVFEQGLSPEMLPNNSAGTFDITFTCQPQRWLKSGENVTMFTEDGTITNPTPFSAAPLLRVYGTGVLGIGDESITIIRADEYTDIDCDIMDAYKGTVNRNAYVQVSGADFPTLAPGKTGISLGTGITKVEITPRWWML